MSKPNDIPNMCAAIMKWQPAADAPPLLEPVAPDTKLACKAVIVTALNAATAVLLGRGREVTTKTQAVEAMKLLVTAYAAIGTHCKIDHDILCQAADKMIRAIYQASDDEVNPKAQA